MHSARWTTIARLAVLGMVLGVALDLVGLKLGLYLFGAGFFVLLLSLRQP